jgi:uncharacterized membrane protein
MLALDIAGVVIIFGLILFGAGWIISLRRRTPHGEARAAEAQGAENAVRHEIAEDMQCEKCDKGFASEWPIAT